MNTFQKLSLCSALFLSLSLTATAILPTSALAGPKPSGAKSAKGAEIKAAFAGKSWRWSKGGAHFASNGKFHAIFDGSVGLGSWSVSGSGTLCHNATWYWDDDGLVTKKVKDCYKHVVDPDGDLWQHSKDDGWYKFPARRISSGDKYGSKVNRMKKKLGI